MTDAGFFRGTSADQDNRFANKQKKILKDINSPILSSNLNTTKIDIESIRPWIEEKIKEILEKDDELLSQSIFEHLAEKEPDGKLVLVFITSFVEEPKALKFMEELWTKLLELQENSNGLNKVTENTTDPEPKSKDTEKDIDVNDKPPKGNNDDEPDNQVRNSQDPNNQSSSSSRPHSPPSRSVSKSPGAHRLDEQSRGRPRKRNHGEGSHEGSRSPTGEGKDDKSRSSSSSSSKSRSRSKSVSSTSQASDKKQSKELKETAKKSGSKSKSRSRSRSRSKNRSRSKSYSRSHSRSSSRSPRHRSRSPYNRSFRGRRSRSRSRGYDPRSRSPKFRRGYPVRGSYRGPSFSYHDRRRGMMPVRRRTSPWSSRRRYSPRSPVRRRRTPSYSPRRRRSPSPYSRRISRSRSPPSHMMGRSIPSPRSHMPGVSQMNMIGSRNLPHHGIPRHGPLPPPRSPERLIDHRGYGVSHTMGRHSPPILGRQLDLPSSHKVSDIPGQPGPAPQSPTSSSKKKHKKDKKHRKHKKSKKHRSPTPEKRRKHKKHKKTKKHKSR